MSEYYALVVVVEATDADTACDDVGRALDMSDIPDGTTYFVGTPWPVVPVDSTDPVFDTDSALVQR